MKFTRLYRIFGIAVIMALLLTVLPAAPALAYTYDIELDEEQGKVGDSITVTGDGFSPSTDSSEKWARIYFALDEADESDNIDTEVETYEYVKSAQIGYVDESDEGEWEATFTIPSSMIDGDDDEDVVPGTYYIYVTITYTTGTTTIIRSVAEFMIIGGDVTLSPEEGPVDTEVEIAGEEFATSEDITIEFDGDELSSSEIGGDIDTDSSGDFISSIFIPAAIAGDHTIAITVSGYTVESTFTVEPDIYLNTTSGEAGTSVTVDGTGFSRRGNVTMYLNNTPLKSIAASTSGSFYTDFTVPLDLPVGIYSIDADDTVNIATATFTILAPQQVEPEEPEEPEEPAPTIPTASSSISANAGDIGTDIFISGSGFATDAEAIIKYDGTEIARTIVGANGILVAPFKIPASQYGDHAITISDGTNTQTLTFTVESEAPSTPTPLEPFLGAQLKSPMSFDWKDVTDKSAPVTYTLQIATSKDFATADIVLEKTELSKSEYTLTVQEEPIPADSEGIYYWRVKASDAASNESGWTGAGEFSISTPFSLPTWALYTFIGLGGLLLFGIGYLLGRKTAFYY